ncbi:MAG TPA: hypothetical protein VK997_05180, partial [Deferrisomatales bacterium]|nr:hypothetical protein [Deferrisomatales bacterium]
MTDAGNDRHLALRVEELGRQLAQVERRLRALEGGQLFPPATAATDPAVAPNTRGGDTLGGMSTLFGRAAVACFLLVVALVLRTLADSQWLLVDDGIWLGLGYAVLLNVAGWGLFRRRSGQAPTCCWTGAVLLGAVLLEGVFRHRVVPLPLAYILLAAVAGGTGWALRERNASGTLWVVGAALFGAGAGLLWAQPPLPWPLVLVLVGNAMAGRRDAGPARVVFRAAAWLALMSFWGVWGLALVGALRSGAAVPARLAPGWFGWLLLATLLYFLISSLLEAARQPRRWLDAFDACLLPVTLGWGHVVGVRVLPRLGGGSHWLGGVELGAAGLVMIAGWRLGKRAHEHPQGTTGTGLLAVGATVLLFLGLPIALGGVAAVALWAVAAHGLARLGQHWQSGGARLASYVLPAAGCAYGWFASGLAPGGASGIAAGLVFAASAVAAVLQYLDQRRRKAPARSRFFATVDRRDDTGALPLLAAVGFGMLALRGGLHPLLGAVLADPAEALSAAQSVFLSLAALALIVGGQRRSAAQVRGVGVLVLAAAAVRVFGFDLLASRGLPLVFAVLGFGVAAGGAA